MNDLFQTFLSGLIGGIIGPAFYYLFIWKAQKKVELKRKAFEEATTALAMQEIDALDTDIQSENAQKNARLHVGYRNGTFIQMQRARYLVKAFFSPEVSYLFNKALNTKVNIANIPNTEFQESAVELYPPVKV